MSENNSLDNQHFIADDETGRLLALRQYDILDSDTEKLFDDLVALAQALADVPIAFISLVDKDRQWFKSSYGLDIKETPRNIAFCDHAIRDENVMVILDAEKDPRFAQNPLVTGPPHIRFYAGAPIISPDGYAVGTLCISDTSPRENFDLAPALAALARQAAALMQLRKNAAHTQIAAELAADQRDRLWDSSLDMMLIARGDGTLVAGNPAWVDAFGHVDQDDAKTIAEYFHDSELKPPIRMHDGDSGITAEYIMRNIMDQPRHLSWNLAMQDGLIFGIARDITDAKETEEKLAQAQRMDSIGQLTGGIAHDFNNLLTIILGNLDVARGRLKKGSPDKAEVAITNAREGAQRAASLTQRLLAFARKQSLTPTTISVEDLLNGLKPLARQALDARHRLEVVNGDDLWPLHIDAAQLENAIINLVVNARDAMEDDGAVKLKSENYTIEEQEAATLSPHARAGNFLKICVSDTGSGIPKEIAEKIFEPFYTTKETGKGTGLGLSQVQGFVVQSGGFVTLESASDEGTTISLWLPAAMSGVQSGNRVGHSIGSDTLPNVAGKFVLVVEDNHDLRNHVSELLRDENMVVTEAGDGEEALAILRGMRELPELVLTDVRMPRMDGHELAQTIAKEWPEMPIVMMSGYAGGDLPKDSPHSDFLAKPFSPDQLVDMMHKHIAA